MQQGVDYIGVSVGALVLNEKGEILLGKRSLKTRNEQGKWEAPGGAVHFGETREEAIKREIREEFGINIEITDLLHVSDEILKDQGHHWVATTFIAKIKNGQTPKIMEPEKCDEIGWFSLEKLPSPISYITNLDLAAYKKFSKKSIDKKCPVCGKKMKLQRKDFSYREDRKEYKRVVFWCEKDDTWVSSEIPTGKTKRLA